MAGGTTEGKYLNDDKMLTTLFTPKKKNHNFVQNDVMIKAVIAVGTAQTLDKVAKMVETCCPNVDIVARLEGVKTCVSAINEHQPDLLLMDLNMPIKTGEQALHEIIEEFPNARIIVFSSVSDRSLIDRCCQAGAMNFVLKDCSVPEMVEIIRDAMQTD